MGRIIDRRRVMGRKGLLPSGYTQVEYIENTSDAYINTGIRPYYNTRCVCDLALNSIVQYSYMFGENNDRFTQYWFRLGTERTFHAGYGVNGTYVSPETLATNKIYHIDMDKNILLIESSTHTEQHIFPKDSRLVSSIPLFIFYSNGTQLYYGKIKVYNFIIYDDEVLVRNFIPCISPNNVVGMYDTVEGKFYSSPNGVAFIAGPVV